MVEKYDQDNIDRLISLKTSLNAINYFLYMNVSGRLEDRRRGSLTMHSIQLLRNLPEQVYSLSIQPDLTVTREVNVDPKIQEHWNLGQAKAYIQDLDDSLSK